MFFWIYIIATILPHVLFILCVPQQCNRIYITNEKIFIFLPQQLYAFSCIVYECYRMHWHLRRRPCLCHICACKVVVKHIFPNASFITTLFIQISKGPWRSSGYLIAFNFYCSRIWQCVYEKAHAETLYSCLLYVWTQRQFTKKPWSSSGDLMGFNFYAFTFVKGRNRFMINKKKAHLP